MRDFLQRCTKACAVGRELGRMIGQMINGHEIEDLQDDPRPRRA